MFRFSRSSIGCLRTARWYPLVLPVVLAVSAAEPAVAVAAAPSEAAGDGFPVPALVGGMVLAFAVGLTAAEVRRRRRGAPPPPAEPVATAEPPPPEPAHPPRPWEAWVERPSAATPEPPPPKPATKRQPTAAPKPPPPKPATKRQPTAAPKPPPPKPATTPEPPAPLRPAPPPPKPAAPSRPRPRVVRLEPPRGAPPPPPPGEPSWLPPEPVDPAARSARGPAARDPELRKAPEAPLPDDSTPAAAPESSLDQAPESPVARRSAPRDEPWPEEAETHWTCEIMWKAGYVKSSFRAMAGAPGSSRRRPIGESPPLRWTLMTDPDPPTPEMVAGVRALVDALVADGWERIRSAGPWYAQRFLWRGSGRPGSVEVEPMDAGEASSA